MTRRQRREKTKRIKAIPKGWVAVLDKRTDKVSINRCRRKWAAIASKRVVEYAVVNAPV